MTPFMLFMAMWIENNNITAPEVLVITDMVVESRATYLQWEQILRKAEYKLTKQESEE